MKLFQRHSKFGGTPICLIYSLVKSFNEYYYFKILIPCSRQKYCFWQESFWRLSKQKRKMLHYAFGHAFDLVMLCSILSCFSWHILLQGQEFWVLQLIPHVLGQKVKFTIHLSLFTITIHLSLFTSNFCLFKGGCPLYFKQVFSVLSSRLLS